MHNIKSYGCLKTGKLNRHIDRYVLGDVYHAYVQSVVDYSYCEWDPVNTEDKRQIERVKKFALRI